MRRRVAAHLEAVGTLIGSIEKRIKMRHRSNEASQRVQHRGSRAGSSDGAGPDGISIRARRRGLAIIPVSSS
jgi:hypothetical protein